LANLIFAYNKFTAVFVYKRH